MPRSARLRLCDLRAIHQLVAECRELGDDPVRWRRHFLAGAARLAGAAAATEYEGTWVPFCFVCNINWGVEESGFDPHAFDRLNVEFVRTRRGPPLLDYYLAALEKDGGPALSRADVMPDADWYRSDFYRDFIEPTGVDATMYCANRRTAAGHLSGLALVRPAGEADFAPRVRPLVREVYTAVVPLIGGSLAGFDDPSPADLPPRVRAVLRCLLEGDSDKQIAARLGITRYTVNHYTKMVYLHFGASTRAELLARWVRRGWGGRFAWAEGK
jgi:DNA-binding CsgD family transcriptional regulator